MTVALAEERLAQLREPLAEFLAVQAGADLVEVLEAEPLSGGAIQENWRLKVEFEGGPWGGRHDLVLRTDSPSGVAVS